MLDYGIITRVRHKTFNLQKKKSDTLTYQSLTEVKKGYLKLHSKICFGQSGEQI